MVSCRNGGIVAVDTTMTTTGDGVGVGVGVPVGVAAGAGKGLPPLFIDYPLPLLTTATHSTGKTDSFTIEASRMTLTHNSIIRGFNSIYQTAPRLSQYDYPDFIGYCLAWHRFVEEHHHFEETMLYPAIERIVDVKGLMDGAVEEHAAFHDGLSAFQSYLLSISDPQPYKPSKSSISRTRSDSDSSNANSNYSTTTPPHTAFSAPHLLHLMDTFSPALHSHLTSEPRHLRALSRYAPAFAAARTTLPALASALGKKIMTLDYMLNVLPIFILNLETHEYEGGRWRGVAPPVAGVTRWLLFDIVPLWRGKTWWRFVSCDSRGKRRRLGV